MEENKLDVVTKLFEGKGIRSVWNKDVGDYYSSVTDVISVLTDSSNPRNYWKVLKHRLVMEGNQLVTNCNQLKMKSSDGKFYNTDVLDTEGIFRLIESVPSKNAEPFKLWLAKKHKPYGLKENKKIARKGGNVAKDTRNSLENKLGYTVISSDNSYVLEDKI